MSTKNLIDRVVCIYHENCADGMAAAWIVQQKYPQAILIPAQYGDVLPIDQIEEGNRIYIVDFSYPSDHLEALEIMDCDTTVIDHHQTAIDRLSRWSPSAHTTLILDSSKSGCMLTWEYLYPNTLAPMWIQAIGDRDIWAFKKPHTREICEVIYSKPLTIGWLTELNTTPIDSIISKGKELYAPKLAQWIKRITECAYSVVCKGYRVPCINIHPTENASEILNLMAKDAPFAIGWFYSKDHIQYSFRSDKDNPDHIDVAKLAESLGGGGHRHAAGWRVGRI